MYVQAGLPPFISGRPGQRSELITAVAGRSSVRRWSATLTTSALATSGCGVSLVAALGSGCGAAGVVLSTEPSTALGRYVARPFRPDFHAKRYRPSKSANG